VPLAPPGADVPDPGALPPVPTSPPSPPDLPGVAQVTAPTPPAPTPPPVPGPPPVPTVPPLSIAFVPGSAQLPPDQQDALKKFAATRGSFKVAVTGFGEATTSDPDAQEAALVLGQARAQAIASALMANGVPGNAVRTDALATGHGGVARLVN
jgi:outer membrane protein OmpA-like peptidoglycan-associated protein